MLARLAARAANIRPANSRPHGTRSAEARHRARLAALAARAAHQQQCDNIKSCHDGLIGGGVARVERIASRSSPGSAGSKPEGEFNHTCEKDRAADNRDEQFSNARRIHVR